MTETQLITHTGRKVLAILPYARYKRMEEELDDYACLKALRAHLIREIDEQNRILFHNPH